MKSFIRKIGSVPSIFLCIVFPSFVSALWAQDTINGVITDSLFGSAIDSVNVSSGGFSTTTNASGAFSLVISATRALFSAAAPEHPEQRMVNLNTATGLISWSASAGNVSIVVLDVRGRVAARYAAGTGAGAEEYSLAGLPEGFYLVCITLRKQTAMYKFLRLQGNPGGGAGRTIPEGADQSALGLATATVTQPSRIIVCAKTGYKTDTVTIAAGTPTSAVAAIKMIEAAIPQEALETVQIQANGKPVTFKTSLDSGQVFLLKACGALQFGAYALDAEYGSFSQGASIKDSVGTTYIGINIGVTYPRVLSGVTEGPMRWFGPYNASHIYYMTVSGSGKPLTMTVVKADSTAPISGAITVSLVRLSPFPQTFSPQLDSLQAPLTRTIVYSHLSPSKPAIYLLSCAGEGKVGGSGLGYGDAEYDDYTDTPGSSSEDVGDAGIDYGIGVDDTNVTSTIPRSYWWGPWRLDHTYYMLYAGTGKPISFLYFDSNYGDNSTTIKLTVRLYSTP
ncbi:MAG: T9SS type A sorting domain-containing protein [Chitinispirillaceae bacterium]|jgi:hypothetical protein